MRELPGHLADLESDVPAQWLGFRSQSASREAEAWRSREGGREGDRARLTSCQPLSTGQTESCEQHQGKLLKKAVEQKCS